MVLSSFFSVLLSHNERCELATDEYLPVTSALEQCVILVPNPDAQKKTKAQLKEEERLKKEREEKRRKRLQRRAERANKDAAAEAAAK